MIARAEARTDSVDKPADPVAKSEGSPGQPALGIVVAVVASAVVWPVLAGLWLLLAR